MFSHRNKAGFDGQTVGFGFGLPKPMALENDRNVPCTRRDILPCEMRPGE